MKNLTTWWLVGLCAGLLVCAGCPSDDDDDVADDDDITADDDDDTTQGDDDDDTVDDDDSADDDDTGDDDDTTADDDDSAGDDDTEEQLVTNLPNDCTTPYFISPYAGEEEHWGATRLTPPYYPFEVVSVLYTLPAEDDGTVLCNTALEHTIQVFVGTDPMPPATPVPLWELTVPAGSDPYVQKDLWFNVSPSVTLTTGEHLFISIQFAGTYPEVQCLLVCADPGAEANRNWWSNAGTTPYSWATLSSFGLDHTFMIYATGS